MRLLRVIESMDTTHGGPSAGLRAITPVLAAAGHATEFVCLDDPRRSDLSELGAPVHALGPTRPGFAYNARLRPWLRANRERFDAVFIHGMWQYTGFAVSREIHGHTPYFVFPHGMLDPWFRRAYPAKHFKKWLYWLAVERRTLGNATAVLFTCEVERRLACKSFWPYSCTERVVAYGTQRLLGDRATQIGRFRTSIPDLGTASYWLYLGRVHPKKGLDLLLESYAQIVTDHHQSVPTPHLVVAGPCENTRLLERLKAEARRIGSGRRVHFPGMLAGDLKAGALAGAEAFVLPSHQENFGLAVVEALSVGTPVLISTHVNIYSEITEDKAGLAEPDDLPGTVRLLRRWSALASDERSRMRVAAVNCFASRFEINKVAASLMETIQPLMGS